MADDTKGGFAERFINPTRKIDLWQGITRTQYRLLRLLDMYKTRKFVVGLVVLYAFLGCSAIAFNLDLVCLKPRLVVRSDVATVQQASEFQRPSLRGVVSEMMFDSDGNQRMVAGRRKPLQTILKVHNHIQHVKNQRRTRAAHVEQLCESPTSQSWENVARFLEITCLCISSFLLIEHVLRLSSATISYYIRNFWLLLDFVCVVACFIGDAAIAFVFHPLLLGIWMEETGDPIVEAMQVQVPMTVIRLMRCFLLYRVYRFVRTEWNPASEVSRTMEVVEMLKSDMPHIDLLNVSIIRNQRQELKEYAFRKQRMEEDQGDASEMLLFLGTRHLPPEDVANRSGGLDNYFAVDGELGIAVYGAERPSYVDICDCYIDKADETCKTRKIVVFTALVGKSQDLGHESSPGRRFPDPEFDSTHGGPWEPKEYNPEVFDLPRRDIASRLYALYEPRFQTLPLAIITYKNEDSFDEIDRVKDWREHYKTLPPQGTTLNRTHADALKSLSEAIDSREADKVNDSLQNCAEKGVSEVEIDAVKYKKKHDSEVAGISLAYLLSDTFQDLATQVTGLDDPTFIDMAGHFFTNSGKFAVGANMLCPRDLKQGCSYLDSLPSHWRDEATLFLSWVWRYKLSTLRNALKRWADLKEKDPRNEFLYICFFCNNQYRILVEKVATGSDDMGLLFEARLTSIGHAVAVLDDWEDALYLKRIWTIFEQYIAAKVNVPLDFVLPEHSAKSMLVKLDQGFSGFQTVIDAISTVHAENAEATMPEDEAKVKELIRKDIGFERVNRRVKEQLSSWVAGEIKGKIDEMVSPHVDEDTVADPSANLQP